MTCAECGTPLAVRSAADRRDHATPPAGKQWHKARGLCHQCYYRCRFGHMTAWEAEIALSGGSWKPDPRGIQRWVPAS